MNLHGIGECGLDNKNQVDQSQISRQWMLDSVKTKYQAFVLYPQCPSSSYEWGYFNTAASATVVKGHAGLPAIAAVKVIDSLIKVYPIDTTRIYVGGLSWGGLGTEALMVSYPNKFAAAFPQAGENALVRDSANTVVSIMTKTPFWVWHGTNDGTVPFKLDSLLYQYVLKAGVPVIHYASKAYMNTPTLISSDSLAKAVAAGAKYLFSDVTGGDHASGWLEAYNSPNLVPWLMSKSRVNGNLVFTWPAPGPASATTAINPGMKANSTSKNSGKTRLSLHGSAPVVEISKHDYSVAGKRLPLTKAGK